MGSGAWRTRAGALVLMGALAVHELRYALTARGADEHAHVYMSWVIPLVCALVALGLLEFLLRLAFRAMPAVDRDPPPAGVRWLGVSMLLLGIFCAQEVLELLLAHGRVEVAEALVGHGAWVAAPLCFAAGAVIALLLRGASALLARIRGRRAEPGRPVRPSRRIPRSPAARRPPVLACNLAGRAPPLS